MTAISPLQHIHKKGIFGDHHKQNESDLLNISEVKNLTIVQIVQYKKSKIDLNNLKIDGLEFPSHNLNSTSKENTRILNIAPKTWLLVSSNENIEKKINETCDKENFAITDISHSRAVIQIKGKHAKEILKKGCPININKFEKNNCAGTIFHGIAFIIDFVDNNPDQFNLLTLRSFGESFYHHVTDAALEYGYVGI